MAAMARSRLPRNAKPARVATWKRASKVAFSPAGRLVSTYVRLMVRVLEGAPDIALFGCGGGALASELHNRGSRVTVVDDNPISFEIARRYFWMPSSIRCVADGMAEFLEEGSGEYAAIGVDVGGPSFDYDSALAARTCALLGRRLATGGRIAVNIARDWAQDTTLVRIADRLLNEDLDAKIFEGSPTQRSKRPNRGDQTGYSDERNRCGRDLIGLSSDATVTRPHGSMYATQPGVSPHHLQQLNPRATIARTIRTLRQPSARPIAGHGLRGH